MSRSISPETALNRTHMVPHWIDTPPVRGRAGRATPHLPLSLSRGLAKVARPKAPLSPEDAASMPDEARNFRSIYRHGLARVAAATLPCAIADPAANLDAILDEARRCDGEGAALAVFPELALSGYAIEDLLLQDALLDGVERAAEELAAASAELQPVLVVGAPVRHKGRVYNTALIAHRGELLGVVPKSYLPTYREFYERRQCAPGDGSRGETIRFAGRDLPFGPDLLFAAEDLPGFVLHVEICEDFWVPIPPSAEAALAGATVLANISGSPITIGRAETRQMLCRSQSARCLAAYVYAAAGAGESTTEVAWDGQCTIFENGELLAESERFPPAGAHADGDLRRLPADPSGARRGVPPHRLPACAAARRYRLAAAARALPLRARRSRAPRPGLLRSLQHPSRRTLAAHRRDRREAPRHRRLGRPRFDASAPRRGEGDRRLGAAAPEHHRRDASRLRHQRRDARQRDPPHPVARRRAS